jgi:acetylornithine deacetylase/succinyl-diaminopimelate desuccinylase-like protein
MTPAGYAVQQRGRFLAELKKLVSFPSVSAQPRHREDLRACALWLRDRLRAAGLAAELHPTAGHPVLVAKSKPRIAGPTVLVYGHYDVQPPEPLELWRTPPFAPVIKAGKMYGRGTSDNKGQILAHINAVVSYLATATPLPVNVIFCIEGEEEIGSPNLAPFLKRHAAELRADYVVVSDSALWGEDTPAVTYGTRGVIGFEVRVDGPNRDLHSGVFGGSLANPAMVLAQLLAGCVDAAGRVAIRGFYEDVLPLTAWERRQFRRLAFDERAYANQLGVPVLAGEKGFSALERRWARPTLEINGLTSGYQGPGQKTIVPAWASAKITCRLVPNQRPATIAALLRRHLRQHCPPGVRLTVSGEEGAAAFIQSPHSPAAQAAARALTKSFGQEPVFIREGGSLPILPVLQKTLGAEVLLLGLGTTSDNWHSPNEKFDLVHYRKGTAMSIALLTELGGLRL